jgi:GH35 family endo-1,4-beta-xylanase
MSQVDRLRRDDAARSERQAVQAEATRSVLGRTRSSHLKIDVFSCHLAGNGGSLAGVKIVLALVAVLLAVQPSSAATCRLARLACGDAATWTARACDRNCTRLGDHDAVAQCRAACRSTRVADKAACRAVHEPCAAACDADPASCVATSRACRSTTRAAHRSCLAVCAQGDLHCTIGCDRARAVAAASCGYVTARTESGVADLPDLPMGEPADLSVLLDRAEMAIVAAADARAETLRSRPLRLWVGAPGANVTVTQVRHGFEFGFPIDLREFVNAPEDLAFYTDLATKHANFVVMETGMKWRAAQPAADAFSFAIADSEIAWAESNGFPVKGHTLLWGNVPPFSSGSGVPEWVRTRFPNANPTPAQKAELTQLIRTYVEATVSRYRGRIDTWDVTNETLNVFTPFFMERLGTGILPQMYDWVHAIDPGCELVFNEWITEVFTGLPGPDAADVRDRVQGLLAGGAPIHAIGQQAHFVPGIVYAGGTADLSQRTRIDDYEVALDTLAEAGLPVHITETNFVAPDEPEKRAAQAEALMRVWWGNPAVEQIVFWGLWNKVNARNHLHHGLWDDDGTITRHGAAVASLLNDRWRTRATLAADASGAVTLRATIGDYVASWERNGQPVYVRFRVQQGPGTAVVAAIQ